jgi:signal peptidase II
MSHALEDRIESVPHQETAGLIERTAPLLLIAALVFALDQATKALIRSRLAIGEVWPHDWELIRLSHVENDGAAFGILQGAGPLLVITAAVAVILLGLTITRHDTYPRSQLYALALILGGAVGNLADRLARGSVTDFIDPTHYPSFNIADSAIVIGVSATLILTLFERDAPEAQRSTEAAGTPDDPVEPDGEAR